jgi:hypothetical protein
MVTCCCNNLLDLQVPEYSCSPLDTQLGAADRRPSRAAAEQLTCLASHNSCILNPIQNCCDTMWQFLSIVHSFHCNRSHNLQAQRSKSNQNSMKATTICCAILAACSEAFVAPVQPRPAARSVVQQQLSVEGFQVSLPCRCHKMSETLHMR